MQELRRVLELLYKNDWKTLKDITNKSLNADQRKNLRQMLNEDPSTLFKEWFPRYPKEFVATYLFFNYLDIKKRESIMKDYEIFIKNLGQKGGKKTRTKTCKKRKRKRKMKKSMRYTGGDPHDLNMENFVNLFFMPLICIGIVIFEMTVGPEIRRRLRDEERELEQFVQQQAQSQENRYRNIFVYNVLKYRSGQSDDIVLYHTPDQAFFNRLAEIPEELSDIDLSRFESLSDEEKISLGRDAMKCLLPTPFNGEIVLFEKVIEELNRQGGEQQEYAQCGICIEDMNKIGPKLICPNPKCLSQCRITHANCTYHVFGSKFSYKCLFCKHEDNKHQWPQISSPIPSAIFNKDNLKSEELKRFFGFLPPNSEN
jgi:hypothetical protein